MVSIVIVSHSKCLAEGVLELAEQMSQGKVKMSIAAGIDDPINPIGTDPVAVMSSIESVYTPDGVLVLVDMGSAILSTDMALELLDPEIANAVHLCAAPLIEGTMAACVAAAAGLPIAQVVQETHFALTAKYEQLNQIALMPSGEHASTAVDAAIDEDCQHEFTWQVQNPHGIHARPSSAIVAVACQYDAEMWLSKKSHTDGEQPEKVVNAKSLNRIALLGVKQQDTVICRTKGPQAEQALDAFAALAENHFGEDITAQPQVAPPVVAQPTTLETNSNGSVQGIAASDGIVIAPAMHYQVTLPEVPQRDFTTLDAEIERFNQARRQVCTDLEQLIQTTTQKASAAEAEIFKAHQHMLTDPELAAQVAAQITQHQHIAEQAWHTVVTQTAQAYQQAGDSYLVERANDVYDMGRRVMQLMTGQHAQSLNLSEPVILFAEDLSPSDTAQLDPTLVKGLCLEKGGSTSHSAILARSLGIPAVVGLAGVLTRIQNGQTIILDGTQGQVWLNPTPEQQEASQQQLIAAQEALQRAQREAQLPAVTQDGHAIEVFANIASVEDAQLAATRGAEGVGLLRSEFLFMDAEAAPNEEEQTRFYTETAKAFSDQTVIVRTLDIGGDKPLTYLQQQTEENPFLGCRGIRLCLQNPAVFKIQLKALLRTRARFDNLQIMFPMIATVEELLAAKALLELAHQELLAEGKASVLPKVGIMIEVPAAVANAAHLAKHADFFSIGTNDLTQYVMAADRGNESVSHLISTLQPAVLRMIEMTVQAAHAAGIPVGVCGEMAGDASLTSTLIGLGVDELSMSSIRVAAVKSAVRNTTQTQAKQHAQALLQAETLNKVRHQLNHQQD